MEQRFLRDADIEALVKIWPELDERSQYVLSARYFLEKPYEEIAKDLGIKPPSVRMALTRARKNVYQLMEPYMEDDI